MQRSYTAEGPPKSLSQEVPSPETNPAQYEIKEETAKSSASPEMKGSPIKRGDQQPKNEGW